MTNPACALCLPSASSRPLWSNPYERPDSQSRARQAGRPVDGRPVGFLSLLPGRRGRPRAPRPAQAGAGCGVDRGRPSPAGSWGPRGSSAHTPDGRPVPGTRVPPARRRRKPIPPGGVRPSHRVTLGRCRVRPAGPAGARAARPRIRGRQMISGRLRFDTSQTTEFVDLTKRINDEVQRAGLRTGRLHLQSLHTTVGLAINENEPLLLRDLQHRLERLAPGDAGYEHDDFTRRFEVAVDESVNGHAHCRQLLLTGFATLLVEEGKLVLGRWQSVFAVDLDGPRHRELAIQLDGEFAEVARETGNQAQLVELEITRQLMVDPDAVAMPMRRLLEAGG